MTIIKSGAEAIVRRNRSFNTPDEQTRAELKVWSEQPEEVYREVEESVRAAMTSRLDKQLTSIIYGKEAHFCLNVDQDFKAILIHTIIRDVLSKEVILEHR